MKDYDENYYPEVGDKVFVRKSGTTPINEFGVVTFLRPDNEPPNTSYASGYCSVKLINGETILANRYGLIKTRTNSGCVSSLSAFICVHLRFVLQNLPLYFSSNPKNHIFNTYFINTLRSSRALRCLISFTAKGEKQAHL
ncbi:Uncharacterised protein [uncultured archaeon]|nr:Uncharacterised protein [uncultured archaeon]